MSITSVDDIATGLASSVQHHPFHKNLSAAKAAGTYVSSWIATGYPTAGTMPNYNAGSGYTCSKATLGALDLTNATIQLYLAKFMAGISQPGSILLVDRLWHCANMGFANATYTVTTPGSLPARITDNGLNCEIWCEVNNTNGAASGTLTVSYHDSANSLQSGVIAAVQSAPAAGQVQLVPPVNNLGVKDIVSATNSVSWTSGTFGITVVKRYAEIPVNVVGGGVTLDWAGCGLAKIPNDACLQFLYLANNTTAAILAGSIDIIDK